MIIISIVVIIIIIIIIMCLFVVTSAALEEPLDAVAGEGHGDEAALFDDTVFK